jgi:hypothetical protein
LGWVGAAPLPMSEHQKRAELIRSALLRNPLRLIIHADLAGRFGYPLFHALKPVAQHWQFLIPGFRILGDGVERGGVTVEELLYRRHSARKVIHALLRG